MAFRLVKPYLIILNKLKNSQYVAAPGYAVPGQQYVQNPNVYTQPYGVVQPQIVVQTQPLHYPGIK